MTWWEWEDVVLLFEWEGGGGKGWLAIRGEQAKGEE